MAATPKKSTSKTDGHDPTAGRDAVAQYLKTLDHSMRPEVEALRRIIVTSDSRVTEGIKWNVPSFYFHNWFATFDLRSRDWVQVVFHRGAKVKAIGASHYVKDPDGILKWITNDRCIARFVSKHDVESKATAFAKIVTEWVENLSRNKT